MSTSHSTTPSTPSPPSGQSSSTSRVRLLVLLGLLGLMLGALWYDYKVARPAVENAYARIAQLNSEINSRAGKQYMTSKDVQNELKRAPIETFTTDGGYMVEVYGWRSGLPTKTHKYYAVYTQDTPYIFLKHYMNNIEMDELKNQPLILEPGPNANSTELIVGVDSPRGGPGGGPKKDQRKKDGTDTESATPGGGAKANEASERLDDVAPTVEDSAVPAKKTTATPDSKVDEKNEKKESAGSSSEPIPESEKQAADKAQTKS